MDERLGQYELSQEMFDTAFLPKFRHYCQMFGCSDWRASAYYNADGSGVQPRYNGRSAQFAIGRWHDMPMAAMGAERLAYRLALWLLFFPVIQLAERGADSSGARLVELALEGCVNRLAATYLGDSA